MRPLRHLTLLSQPFGSAAAAYRRDPGDWLPAPVLLHGVEAFHCSVTWWRLAVVVSCRLGGPWVRTTAVSRRVRLDGATSWLEPWLPTLDGDLDVDRGRDGGAVLRFVGHWTPPRAGVVRPLAGFLARALLRRFVEESGRRLDQLGAQPVRPAPGHGATPPGAHSGESRADRSDG